jgi:hypothetical protein
VIYAYGICDPGAVVPPPRGRGLRGARLRTVKSDALAAVYSRHRTPCPRPSRELVLAHERIVEAVMKRGAVLPLRFGTELTDEEGLTAVLNERRGEFVRALERVRGRVELGLRVLSLADSERDSSDESNGRAYLLARAAEHHRAERVAREVHEPLATIAEESVVRPRPLPPTVFAAAYLLESDRVEEFRSRAAELGAHQDRVHSVVTGPWPPYNFATEDADEDR